MFPASLTPLVIRFGAFGDMVLMIPILKQLHARYGRRCDVVSSGPWSDPLLTRVPAVQNRFYLTSRRAPFWLNRSQQQLVTWLRQRPPGPVYVFESDEKPLSLLRRAGIRDEWICTLRDYPRAPSEHILNHTLRLAHATPAALRSAPIPNGVATVHDTRPVLSDDDHRDCARWLEERGLGHSALVLIQAGNKKTMKGGPRPRVSNVDYWPEENWAQVIPAVRQQLPESQVILCGTPSERPLAEEIVAHLPATEAPNVTIATDELPIPRLLALQARAHSLISVNTGPAHSAAAMGCPLVVMFTRHAHRCAELYAPMATSAPVRIVQPEPSDSISTLASITPQQLVDAWSELVGQEALQRSR